MIASGLIFLLGFSVATFLALLVAPFVARRARRLARREFDATIPVSANEIRASLDLVRAEAALISRRREMEARDMRERAAFERAEAGRIARENAELRMKGRTATETLEAREATLAELRDGLSAREREIERLRARIEELEDAILVRMDEAERLTEENRELSVLAEERRTRLAALVAAGAPGEETPFEPDEGEAPKDEPEPRRPRAMAPPPAPALPPPLPPASQAPVEEPAPPAPEKEAGEIAAPATLPIASAPAAETPLDLLRRDLDYPETIDPLDPTQDDAALRESVSDLAARVLDRATREGPQTAEIERLLTVEEAGDGTSLAARVKRLREERGRAS